MGRKAKHNWPHLYAAYHSMKIERPGYKLTSFCEDQGLPYDGTRIAFKRYEEKQKKKLPKPLQQFSLNVSTEKINIDNESGGLKVSREDGRCLSEQKPDKNRTKPNNGRTMISDGRQSTISMDVFISETVSRLHQKHIETIENSGECADTIIKRIMDYFNPIVTDGGTAVQKKISPADIRTLTSTLKDATGLHTSTTKTLREAYQDGQKLEIIKKVFDGEYDEKMAALCFEFLGLPMPKVVQVILSRTPVSEPEPDNAGTSKEELDDIYNQYDDKKEGEQVWLEKRREDVTVIKNDVTNQTNNSGTTPPIEDNEKKKA